MDLIELPARHAEKYAPIASFQKQANLTQEIYQQLQDKALNDYEEFWGELAKEKITWNRIFTKTLTCDEHPFYRWFEDGVLNVSYNCLDRHLAKQGDKIAIVFESDDGLVSTISYRELHQKVCQFSNALISLDITLGDRVIIYMPHSIEAIIAMLACSRIGAIHSVVFGGFSAKSLADRISDAQASIIITANASARGGKIIRLKEMVDEAISHLIDPHVIKKVIVQARLNITFHLESQRDVLWDAFIANQSSTCAPVMVNSEHPLFILYTSGSTGTPKGVQHTSAGYLLGAMLTMEWVFDLKSDDIFWCTADVGWITGHTYVCYGPLAMGATQIIFEGIPTYPDSSRYWQMIQKHRVTTFYTAPTALRSLIKLGENIPNEYDLSSLRLLGSVGEPINPEVWLWYYKTIGKSRCPIVDTWWQTETGCHMMTPIPGVSTLKPGSCVMPIPGIIADIIDEDGNSLANNQKGILVIKKPFPSLLRTIWGNDQRFVNGYYPKHIANGDYYIAGDSAYRDNDGYFWILGRIDDVLNVSGHRLGTQEIESALIKHKTVAEVAVVGKPHPIKGESICAFVICKNTHRSSDAELIQALHEIVITEIGPIAKPDNIIFVNALPKTRSGKIMRRLLRNIVRNEETTGDLSTLDNPSVINEIKQAL